MSQAPPKFFLTTPIYYVNARPHIGHAYTTIVADVLARRARAKGRETFFLTGTDEHGQKIERSAAAAGIPPQQFTDQVSAEFRALWDRMGLTYDHFIRTTDPAHKLGAQKLFAELYARGAIYLSSYTGQYCVSEEIFVEGPPGVIGPDGKPTETVTEENFFFKLSEYQRPLLDLIESDTLAITPESRKNEVLSFLRGNVAEAQAAGAEIASSDSGKLYVPGALRDLSVSRSSFTWGIPVPEPAASATAKKHVMYVWLDALANYMTAVGYGTDTPEANAMFAKYWPADVHIMAKEITRQHCIYWPAFLLAAGLPTPRAVTAHGWLLFDDSKMSKSKGNIVRTETILDAFGTLCPPPPPPLSFGSEAEESASGTTASPTQPTDHDRDLFAADILRYFLLREIPFGQDGSFSFEAMVTRYNADLANGYGNLVSRTLNMIKKYFDGIIPAPTEPVLEFGVHEVLPDVLEQAIESHLQRGEFSLYLERFNEAVAATDRMLSSTTPWKERETELATQLNRRTSLCVAASVIQRLTMLIYPVLPFTAARVWSQLGLGSLEEAISKGTLRNLDWNDFAPDTRLGPLSPVFPRADKKLIETMTQMESEKNLTKLAEQTTSATEFVQAPVASQPPAAHHTAPPPVAADPWDPAAPPRTSSLAEENPGAQVAGSASETIVRPATPAHTEAPASGIFHDSGSRPIAPPAIPDASPQISIDDFAKIELRVAKILVAERIPKADKLLRLEVDLGHEKRQILSGIAEHYTPEELIGRRIVVITNLAPRKMRGLESHGMLLAASAGENGKPVLATFPDSDDLPLGSRLK